MYCILDILEPRSFICLQGWKQLFTPLSDGNNSKLKRSSIVWALLYLIKLSLYYQHIDNVLHQVAHSTFIAHSLNIHVDISYVIVSFIKSYVQKCYIPLIESRSSWSSSCSLVTSSLLNLHPIRYSRPLILL